MELAKFETPMQGVTPARPLKALILENDLFDRVRLRKYITKADLPIVLTEVSSLEDFDEALDQHAFDLVLLDYALPMGSGLDALEMVQSHHLNANAGIIMVSGRANPKIAVEAIRKGCQDYIAKDDLSVHLLRSVVLNAVNVAKTRRGEPISRNPKALVQSIIADPSSLHILMEALAQLHARDPSVPLPWEDPKRRASQ